MRNKNLIWVIFGALVIWFYSKKVQAANALTVRYLLPQNIRISKGAVMWNQPIVITNPTLTPIDLQSYYVQVQLEAYPIGTAYGTIRTTLMAGGDTTIMSNVVVPVDALISNIPALLNAGASLDLRFVGNIIAEFLTIPIDTRIAVPIPKLFK
jgi:hypothetical protein